MGGRSLLRVLGVSLIAGLAIASAGMAFAPAASAESFVIANGPFHPQNGLILEATGPSGCPAPYCPVANDDLEAVGQVVGGGPYPDCNAVYHYHGFLLNKPDPAMNGCGWGEVIPTTDLSSEVVEIAGAITGETDALLATNPHHAKHATGAALSDLKTLRDHSENLSDEQKTTLKHAITQDQIAKLFFNQADDKDNEHVKRDVKTARKHLVEALELKRSLFDAVLYPS
jgi:hypothetical protein